jgi:hypothetical protein
MVHPLNFYYKTSPKKFKMKQFFRLPKLSELSAVGYLRLDTAQAQLGGVIYCHFFFAVTKD